MFKKIAPALILVISALLAACGEKNAPAAEIPPTAAVMFTSTVEFDPCSSANLPDEVKKIHDLTREFDDYATLASNTPQAQLVQVIPQMQRVLRDAEDRQVPACLKRLKELQLSHMTMVVQTLMTFISAQDNAAAERVNAGIVQARELRLEYDVERARLLGFTVELPPTPAALETAVVNAAPVTATNNGTAGINLRAEPNINAPQAGILGAQVATRAVGRTADNAWILVEIPAKPGQLAWVFAELVSLSAPLDQLPVTPQ